MSESFLDINAFTSKPITYCKEFNSCKIRTHIKKLYTYSLYFLITGRVLISDVPERRVSYTSVSCTMRQSDERGRGTWPVRSRQDWLQFPPHQTLPYHLHGGHQWGHDTRLPEVAASLKALLKRVFRTNQILNYTMNMNDYENH